MAYEMHILHEGYSRSVDGGTAANCSCVLLLGRHKVIVDTMTPWDSGIILKGLEKYGVKKEEIDYVVCSHGHSDHIGCNHLFLEATHIVGHCISKGDHYMDEPFSSGKSYLIDGEDLKVIPTPGHTLSDVTVLAKTKEGIVAVTGDLFEREEDLENDYIWLAAGSESPALQRHSRAMVLRLADCIVPGHGPPFKITAFMRPAL